MTDVTRVPNITISATPPDSPTEGDLWWNSTIGIEFVYYDDGNTIQWVTTQPSKQVLLDVAGGDLTGQYPNPTIIPSVNLTGTPTASTPPPGDDDTSIATTAFVQQLLHTLSPVPPLDIVNTVNTIADLRGLLGRPLVVRTRGYNAANDGGGGPPWSWNPSSTRADDGFMTVRPTNTPVGAAGRYERQFQASGAVSPKWGGCGLGGLDDSPQFQKVIDFGAPIDARGGTFFVTNLFATEGATTCPGCEGGTFRPPASAIVLPPQDQPSNTYMFTVSKLSGFYFRGMTCIAPISTDPRQSPGYGRFFYFTLGADNVGANYEVSGCKLTGGEIAISFFGQATDVRYFHNHITGTWRDGITGPDTTNSTWITDNTLHDGGYCNGAYTPGGAIRIGAGTALQLQESVSICRNHITAYCTTQGQSAIDCASCALTNIDISDNIVSYCGGTIELKTAGAAGTFSGYIVGTTLTITSAIAGSIANGWDLNAVGILPGTKLVAPIGGPTWTVNNSQTLGSVGSPVAFSATGPEDIYRSIKLNNNRIRLFSAKIPQSVSEFDPVTPAAPRAPGGFSLFYASPTLGNKGSNTQVKGNHISCHVRPQMGQGITGILMQGFDDTDLSGNTLIDLNVGIMLYGTSDASPLITAAHDTYISSNVIDATDYAIQNGGTGRLQRLFINNNPMLKGGTNGIMFPNGTVDPFTILNNGIWGKTGTGIDLRGCANGVIAGNMVTGGTNDIVFPAPASSNIVVETNRLRVYVDPNDVTMLSVAGGVPVTPGSGLTNGTRVCTVVGGTRTAPARFEVTVTSGAVSAVGNILEPGSYSSVPVNPVAVTLDVAGGVTPTFNINWALGVGNAITATGAPTGLVIQKNSFDIAVTAQSITGTGFLASENVRGLASSIPTGAGSLGDVYLNSAMTTPTSPSQWKCTTLGASGVAVWAPITSAVAPFVVASGNVGNPSYSFTASPTSGMWWNGAVSFSNAGKEILRLGPSGTSNNLLSFTANNGPTIQAIEGSSGNVTLSLAGAGTSGVILRANGGTVLQTTAPNLPVNFIQVTGDSGTTSPIISAQGTATDLDISLQPKGTGKLRMNTAGSFSANAAVATVLGSLGPTGSRTAVQKWLTINDSAGNPFYIPCF